jgi:hypothetical protein
MPGLWALGRRPAHAHLSGGCGAAGRAACTAAAPARAAVPGHDPHRGARGAPRGARCTTQHVGTRTAPAARRFIRRLTSWRAGSQHQCCHRTHGGARSRPAPWSIWSPPRRASGCLHHVHSVCARGASPERAVGLVVSRLSSARAGPESHAAAGRHPPAAVYPPARGHRRRAPPLGTVLAPRRRAPAPTPGGRLGGPCRPTHQVHTSGRAPPSPRARAAPAGHPEVHTTSAQRAVRARWAAAGGGRRGCPRRVLVCGGGSRWWARWLRNPPPIHRAILRLRPARTQTAICNGILNGILSDLRRRLRRGACARVAREAFSARPRAKGRPPPAGGAAVWGRAYRPFSWGWVRLSALYIYETQRGPTVHSGALQQRIYVDGVGP